MDWCNRIGLYGAYFLGLSGIGFTLPRRAKPIRTGTRLPSLRMYSFS